MVNLAAAVLTWGGLRGVPMQRLLLSAWILVASLVSACSAEIGDLSAEAMTPGDPGLASDGREPSDGVPSGDMRVRLGDLDIGTGGGDSQGGEPDGDDNNPVVHGGWSDWVEQGTCDGVCGLAEQSYVRECTSPAPSNGGSDCVGPATEYRPCVSPACTCGDNVVTEALGEVCEGADTQQCVVCSVAGTQECLGDCQWGTCVAAATLDDLWKGDASLKLYRKLSPAGTGWHTDYGAGAHIEVVGDAWYLFSRKTNYSQPVPAYCSSRGVSLAGIQVRASYDRGRTWTGTYDVVTPTAETPWECMATDGDVYFDATANEWHYLFQCLARSGNWNGCHAIRPGDSPLGPFSGTGLSNPVISDGALWDQICDVPEDDCSEQAGGPGRVSDEGTFHFIEHDGNHHYIGFHGFDGVNGYTSVAKTADFEQWIAGNTAAGVPADAIFDKVDAASWREDWVGDAVGGGHASIVAEAGYYYMLVESADINLLCTADQNWDFGLLRQTSLSSTSWQQLPAGNPIFYSHKILEWNNGTQTNPCNLQYAGIFQDPTSKHWYLHVTRVASGGDVFGIYIYRVESNRNLLDNGDLWKCTTDSWSRLPESGPTNYLTYRRPDLSIDGTCFLATNCGQSPCQGSQSVYQDLPVTHGVGTAMRFGGTFRTESGDGNVVMVVHQLNSESVSVQSTQVSVDVTESYHPAEGSFGIHPDAAFLRFEIYLGSTHTFWVDDMFVAPVDLCP